MSNLFLKTSLWLGLSFLILVTGCTEKPSIAVKITSEEQSESSRGNAPGLSSTSPHIQASITDEDWQKLQPFFQAALPRIEALESAVLWLPNGTMILSAQTDILLRNTSAIISQNAELIQNSASLVESSKKLVEKTELLLAETQKTRKELEKLLLPRAAER